MLGRLGAFAVRRRRWVLVGTMVAAVVAGAFGGGAFDRLQGGGFTDPRSESARGAADLERMFGTGGTNLVLLVTVRDGTVDDAAVVRQGTELTSELAAEPGVGGAFSYWTAGAAPPLRSEDGRRALVLASIGGDDDA